MTKALSLWQGCGSKTLYRVVRCNTSLTKKEYMHCPSIQFPFTYFCLHIFAGFLWIFKIYLFIHHFPRYLSQVSRRCCNMFATFIQFAGLQWFGEVSEDVRIMRICLSLVIRVLQEAGDPLWEVRRNIVGAQEATQKTKLLRLLPQVPLSTTKQ